MLTSSETSVMFRVSECVCFSCVVTWAVSTVFGIDLIVTVATRMLHRGLARFTVELGLIVQRMKMLKITVEVKPEVLATVVTACRIGRWTRNLKFLWTLVFRSADGLVCLI